MLKDTIKILFVISFFSILAGCGLKFKDEKALDKALKDYHVYLQGPGASESLEQIAQRVPQSKRAAFFGAMEATLKKNVIIDFKIRTVAINEEKTKATVEILRTYTDHNDVIKQQRLIQHWEQSNDQWYLVNEAY